jgi:peptidoglycan/LPS O-acetylase OafA/YrhL
MAYIDTLRGFACLWVLLHHSLTTTTHRAHAIPGENFFPIKCIVFFVEHGYLGVSLFLVLSGFCLFYPVTRKADLGSARLDVATFFKRRARRILPPYYAALALFTVGVLLPHSPLHRDLPWYDLPLHLLMLHNLMPNTIESIDGAFWSLALEWQLYLIFPIFILIASRKGFGFLFAVAGIITIAWQIFAIHLLGSHSETTLSQVIYRALPGRLFEFGIGMFSAFAVARPKKLYSVIAAPLAAVLAIPTIYYLIHHGTYGLLIDQIWGIIFGCCIILMARVPEQKFTGNIVLSPLTKIGVFSYSIYLIHQPLMGLLNTTTLHLNIAGPKYAAFSLIRILVLVLMGYLFFLVFEKPWMTHKGNTAPSPRPETMQEA